MPEDIDDLPYLQLSGQKDAADPDTQTTEKLFHNRNPPNLCFYMQEFEAEQAPLPLLRWNQGHLMG